MGANIHEIRRKIKAVNNTRLITKAMQMVAAVKLKKAQTHAETSRPYTEAITRMVSFVTQNTQDKNLHAMMRESEVIRRTAYIVITSDRGLAGGLNSNLLRKFMETLKSKHKSPNEYVIYAIGRKGISFMKSKGLTISQYLFSLHDSPTFDDVYPLVSHVSRRYISESFDELYLVYNQFQNAMVQLPVIKRLLPLPKTEIVKNGPEAVYEFLPSIDEALEELLPRYAQTLIYNAVLESKAAEFMARMTSMNSATKNADDLISDLTLVYNHARQAAITKEITEVVAGSVGE